MFKHSFETSAGAVLFPHTIPGRLLVAKAEGVLTPVKDAPGILAVVDKSPSVDIIPPFMHPFCQSNQLGDITYVDLRPYRSLLTKDELGEVALPTQGAAGILYRRTLLEKAWAANQIDAFYYNIDVPLVIFAKWLTGLLRSRLNLNEAVAVKVQALTAYYYYCLHCAEEDFSEKKVEVFAIKISRILGIPFQELEAWFQPVGYLADLDGYCKALGDYTDSLSLQRLEKRTVWTLTATSWFGSSNVKELIGVALEYPPAFIALVYAGCTEKLYRKAFLSQLIEREGKRLKTQDFVGRVDDLLRESRSF